MSAALLQVRLEKERRRRRTREHVAGFSFRGANDEAQHTVARAWILAGPAETGKTVATLWRLDTLLRATPRAQAALMRKVRVTIGPTVLRTYARIQEQRAAMGEKPATPYGGNNPTWFDYDNGSRLWIGGMDDPGKVLSGERDFIYVNQAEELTQDDWETLSTRSTGRGAVTDTPMLFGDCNPGPADHWILKRRDAGQLTLLQSRHEDNPSLYDDAGSLTEQGRRTMATLDGLTGARRERLRYGRWVGAEGQFFEQWDEARHTCDPFPIPNDWPIWGAFDYGFSHNTAFGLYTRNDSIIYQIGEHVANKWLPKMHAPKMHQLRDQLGIFHDRVSFVVAGHDVFAERGDSSGKTIAQQYAALGWNFSHASTDRMQGAAELLQRLGNPAAGLPVSLRIFRTCTRTIATMPRMVVDPNRPEDVLKVDADADGSGGDDCYDMLRYACMAQRDSWGAGNLQALSSGKKV